MNYTFYINDFEGPLDVLLQLVKQAKMDIYEINLFTLIKEYLDFIKEMQDLNIDVGSDFLLMASSLLHLKSKMLIQVHDELVFNVIKSELEEVKQIVKDIMENTFTLKVPLKVDIEIGNNWYEAK